MLVPVVVRNDGEAFELVAGFHRIAAARSLGLNVVPVVVRDAGTEDADRVVENITSCRRRHDVINADRCHVGVQAPQARHAQRAGQRPAATATGGLRSVTASRMPASGRPPGSRGESGHDDRQPSPAPLSDPPPSADGSSRREAMPSLRYACARWVWMVLVVTKRS
jgi:hypothetical protein